MANVGSLGEANTQSTFDLESQKGVMRLLASVRASAITPEQKNELRDLIFLYSNGGKDPSVRISIEQKVSSYGVTIVVDSAYATPPVNESVIGSARRAPSFSIPPIQSVPVPPNPITSPVQAVPLTPPQPIPSQSQAAPQPIPPQPPVQPVPTAPPFVPSPQPSAQPVPITPPPQQFEYDQNLYLQRIKEIKSLVNQKVGNPVNLVDINNEVGREYMAALLDAMKKLNSGTSVVPAMNRLEEAFRSVEVAITEHDKNSTSPVQAVPLTPPQPIPSQPQAAPQTIPPQPFVPPRPPVQPVPTAPPFVPEPQPVFSDVHLPESKVIEDKVFEPVQVQNNLKPQPESNFVPIKTIPNPTEPMITEIVSSWGKETDQNEVVRNISKDANTAVTSVADSRIKAHTINDLPKASAMETSSQDGDPLFTNEVDVGLEQLLLEWPLFKKSGLFGTGPKGREHPLFKKICSLPIPLVLAGRFEGSSQEIKQSITDYMNGWRYEQGIMYIQGESFERYLRRVIYHILELQKKRNP